MSDTKSVSIDESTDPTSFVQPFTASEAKAQKLMDLNVLFSDLEDTRDTSSRTEKEEILGSIVKGPNGSAFKDLVSFIFNPYRKLKVKVTSSMVDDATDFSQACEDHERLWRDFLALIERLESGQATGNAAREAIRSFLLDCDPEMVEWFAMILNKKLKIGVGKSTIDKFYADLVPRFGVQLCSKYRQEVLPHSYMVQPKMDGARGVCGRFVEGRMVALSRNGKPFYNVDEILRQLSQLEEFYDEPHVFDGEFYAGNWADSISIVRSEKAVDTSKLKFYIFDAIPLACWVAGKVYEEPLRDRDLALQAAVDVLQSPQIVHVPHQLAADPESITALTSRYVAEGWEGAVLKDPESCYQYERTNTWMKFKFVKDVDAVVVGAELGWLDTVTGSIIGEHDPRASDMGGEWSPVVRSLVVDPGNGIRTNVGSGLERDDRFAFYELNELGGLVGLTVEVHFQSFTPDGKLLFPRFIRLRDDK